MAYHRNNTYGWTSSYTSSTMPYWRDRNTFVTERLNPFHLPESIKREMAQNLCNQVDIDDLLRQANHQNTVSFEAVKFDPENLWSEPND